MEITDRTLEMARKLALYEINEEDMAFFFDMTLEELALTAWNNENFFNAITPSDEEILEYKNRVLAKREKINIARRKYLAERPSRRVENAMRARIHAAIKGKSDGALFSRMKYSKSELMEHLASKFKEGMSWENYGKWHIDHIKPCSMFNMENKEEFDECWALENLQPLWAIENIMKGASYAGSEGKQKRRRK